MNAADLMMLVETISHGLGLGTALTALVWLCVGIAHERPTAWMLGVGFYGVVGAILAGATR